MTAPATSSSRAAIHGSGENPDGASVGIGGADGVARADAVLTAAPARMLCCWRARPGIGSTTASRRSTFERGSVAAGRDEDGRSATVVAGGDAATLDSRGGLTGWFCAGSASRVTVPSRLKFESSRGPILSAGAGGGAPASALSCAASGDAASSSATAIPVLRTKALNLLANSRIPVAAAARLWPALRGASRPWTTRTRRPAPVRRRPPPRSAGHSRREWRFRRADRRRHRSLGSGRSAPDKGGDQGRPRGQSPRRP